MNPLEPKPSASTNSAIPARAQCDQVFPDWQVANAKKIAELADASEQKNAHPDRVRVFCKNI
jgi:hypothetical protein